MAQNFCLPYRTLENDRISLIPFEPDSHAEKFMSVAIHHPDLFKYLPWPIFKDTVDLVAWFKTRIESNPKELLFTIFDKTSSEVAGIIGVLNTALEQASTEIGCIVILPNFQKTHISTNATGLLLQWTLDPPPSGLGMRRVQWQANAANAASIRSATRLGFVYEGIQRWQRVIPQGRVGNGVSVDGLPEFDGKKLGEGRDTAVLAICWDEWGEKRAKLVEMMNRRE